MTWKRIKGALCKQLDEEAFYVEKSLNGWLTTVRMSGETGEDFPSYSGERSGNIMAVQFPLII